MSDDIGVMDDHVVDVVGILVDGNKEFNSIEFTSRQKDFICHQIGEWYLGCKNDLVNYDQKTHRLGSAKELLKVMICGSNSEDDGGA